MGTFTNVGELVCKGDSEVLLDSGDDFVSQLKLDNGHSFDVLLANGIQANVITSCDLLIPIKVYQAIRNRMNGSDFDDLPSNEHWRQCSFFTAQILLKLTLVIAHGINVQGC